jgi:hypothetical protein
MIVFPSILTSPHTKQSICENVTCDVSFSRPTPFLVLWSALQLWENLHFETNFVWAPMVTIHSTEEAFLYPKCYVLIAMKSVWSNIEEHNIHNIERLLPSLSLAHAISILQIHLDVGKSCLQRPIQAGPPCLWENNTCDIFTNSMLPTNTRIVQTSNNHQFHCHTYHHLNGKPFFLNCTSKSFVIISRHIDMYMSIMSLKSMNLS